MKDANIVFVTDEKYSMPTTVAICSLIQNKNKDILINIYVVADDISEISKRTFNKLSTTDVRITLIPVDKKLFDNVGNSKIPKSLHVSRAALFKFLLPSMFPKLDKILYLDGDILVKSDIYDLYSQNLSNTYAAVVKDMRPEFSYQPTQTQKLNVNHSAYFNTGMMLLNLDQLRKDNISYKLIDYRINGLNYFMDQDTFNVVFKENVIYLNFKYNLTYSNFKFYQFDDLKEYYELSETDEEDLLAHTVILHLSSKEKPWLFFDTEFTKEWDSYYLKTPYKNVVLRRESCTTQNKSIAELNHDLKELTTELQHLKTSFSYKIGCAITYIPRRTISAYKSYKYKYPKIPDNGLSTINRTPKLIVSLTTYPERNAYLPRVLCSLLRQTEKPDKIVVYLSRNQYSKIPFFFQRFQKYGVDFTLVSDDLKPHKKYFYAMQQFPDDVIITVDDDVKYSPKLIERLYKSYQSHPTSVSASRVHLIKINNKGKILPYDEWQKEYQGRIGYSSMRLMATGVGGVLYPPHCLTKETFNSEFIKNNCLMADDLWLKIMEVKSNIPVILASQDDSLNVINGSQQSALWRKNVDGKENDAQLKQILGALSDSDKIINTIVCDKQLDIIPSDYYNNIQNSPHINKQAVSLNEYLVTLNKIKNDVIICSFVQDTASTYWKLSDIGQFTHTDNLPFRNAFASIVDFSEKKHIEKMSNKTCKLSYTTSSLDITVCSHGHDDPGSSYVYIVIDSKTYLYRYDKKSNRGLHILVLSKKSKKVLSFVRIDLHKDPKMIVHEYEEQ